MLANLFRHSLGRMLTSRFRNKLIASFFAVIVLLSLVMGYVFFWIMKGELGASMIQGVKKVAGQTVETFDLHMQTIGNLGFGFFSDPSLQKYLDGNRSIGDDQYFRDKLQAQGTQNPMISSITLSDFQGTTLSNTYYYNVVLRAAMDNELRKAEEVARRDEGKPSWIASATTPKNSLRAAKTISYVQELKRITVNSQHPVGFIKIDIDPVILQKIFQGLHDDKLQHYYVMDAKGFVYFSDEETTIGSSFAKNPLFKAYLSRQKDEDHFSFQDSGMTYLGFYQKIVYGDWILLSEAPVNRFTQRVEQFGILVAQIAIASMLGAMVLASIIAAGVTRPLKELNQKMKLVEIGDFGATIDIRSKDEFRTIQNSFNKMTAEIRELISKAFESELLKKEAEFKALQTQVNPHFLYNTISTIDSLSSISGDPRISEICQSLGSMLRYTLNGGSHARLEEEIYHLKQYLSIYEIRFEKQFQCSVYLDPLIKGIEVPKFIIQPLVENAIIHGLEPSAGLKRLSVYVEAGDRSGIDILISDNGIGMEPEKVAMLKEMLVKRQPTFQSRTSKRVSIGLSNVYDRLEMNYGKEMEFELTSRPDEGTTIRIKLPTRTEGETAHAADDCRG